MYRRSTNETENEILAKYPLLASFHDWLVIDDHRGDYVILLEKTRPKTLPTVKINLSGIKVARHARDIYIQWHKHPYLTEDEAIAKLRAVRLYATRTDKNDGSKTPQPISPEGSETISP